MGGLWWTLTEPLLFFLPAFVANSCPDKPAWLFAKIGRPQWNLPVSRRWLGENKTWPAYPAAVLGATATLYIERWVSNRTFYNYADEELWLIGLLFGIGVVLGDHCESFVKRRLGKPAGEEWRLWDRTDFVFGGLTTTSLFFGWSVWATAWTLIPTAYFLHPLVNRIGFVLGLRKTVH